MRYPSFKDYVLGGRFNKVASEAVAEAIERAKVAGLPVEGRAKTKPQPSSESDPEISDPANRLSHRN